MLCMCVSLVLLDVAKEGGMFRRREGKQLLYFHPKKRKEVEVGSAVSFECFEYSSVALRCGNTRLIVLTNKYG